MKIGIGFSKGKGFVPISWLIQLVERTPFSHAYITWNATNLKRKMIYEARGAGVRFVGEEMFLKHNQIVEEYWFDISDEAKTRLIQWAVDNAGKKYGKLQFWGFAIVRFLKLFGLRIKNPFYNGNSQYICTELAAVALKDLGILKYMFDQDSEGPRELIEQVRGLYIEKGSVQ